MKQIVVWVATALFSLAAGLMMTGSAQAEDDGRQALALAPISATLARYALGVDDANRPMLEDTFTDDAVLEAHVAGKPPLPAMIGRAAIVDFIMKGREAQKDVRRHIVTNIWIEKLEGSRATVHSYHLIVVTENGVAQTRATGTYVDEMLRGTDGVWRSVRKVVALDAPY